MEFLWFQVVRSRSFMLQKQLSSNLDSNNITNGHRIQFLSCYTTEPETSRISPTRTGNKQFQPAKKLIPPTRPDINTGQVPKSNDQTDAGQ